MLKMTYLQAKTSLLAQLDAHEDWTVTTRNRSNFKPLKVPYVTRDYDDCRVWFKSQSVYLGWTNNLNDARSIHIEDLRVATLADVLESVDYYVSLD